MLQHKQIDLPLHLKGVGRPSQRPASEPVERPEARAPARAYAMRAQEEQDAPDVIRGIFSLYNTSVHALVDLGSTHLYICINLPVKREILVGESG